MSVFDDKVTFTVTKREFMVVYEAVKEFLQDHDVHGASDEMADLLFESVDVSRYQEIKRLVSRLDQLVQLEVIPH